MLERRHVLGGAAVTEELFPGTAAVCLDSQLYVDYNPTPISVACSCNFKDVPNVHLQVEYHKFG